MFVINKPSSEEVKVHRTLFEAGNMAGSATINKVKQFEIVLSFM